MEKWEKELLTIAAVVSALRGEEGAPESLFYVFCNFDMDYWQSIRQKLTTGGLITIRGHYVTLTARGKILAENIDKTMADNRKSKGESK